MLDGPIDRQSGWQKAAGDASGSCAGSGAGPGAHLKHPGGRVEACREGARTLDVLEVLDQVHRVLAQVACTPQTRVGRLHPSAQHRGSIQVLDMLQSTPSLPQLQSTSTGQPGIPA